MTATKSKSDTPVEATRDKEALQCWQQLVEQARHTSNYTEYLSLCRRRKKLLKPGEFRTFDKTIKLALLGGATTEFLQDPLILALEVSGLGCVVHRADYNTFAREMLQPDSQTIQFAPDVAVLVLTPHNLPTMPEVNESWERIKQRVDEAVDYLLGLCERFHAHHACDIILTNFHQVHTRPSGNLASKLPWDISGFLRRVNMSLGERSPAYVHINDVETLAAKHGIDRWFDSRFWFHAKQPVSFECLVPLVRNTASVVASVFGRSAKCLVLDLDNTVWGGVVGDDGVDGIVIGEGDPIGEAFRDFQTYVLQLKQRGVLLAVCSKNDEANAMAPFRQRGEMILGLDDFVAFRANWEPKSENLKAIAQQLNIGLDSLVFVDDNPVERDQVRQFAPDVTVIELTDDPAQYATILDEAACFETVAVSAEDRQRTAQYRANAARGELRETVLDYDSYLESLEQIAVLRPFEAAHLDRITQLTNKTNQFNLMTQRMTRAEIERLMVDECAITLYVRLKDKFGDSGLVSVVHGSCHDGTLTIDQWLMSCRVLHRGVEQLVCNHLVAEAQERGLVEIRGEYRPTKKNGLVADHYQKLGYHPIDSQDPVTRWRLDTGAFQPLTTHIEVVEDY